MLHTLYSPASERRCLFVCPEKNANISTEDLEKNIRKKCNVELLLQFNFCNAVLLRRCNSILRDFHAGAQKSCQAPCAFGKFGLLQRWRKKILAFLKIDTSASVWEWGGKWKSRSVYFATIISLAPRVPAAMLRNLFSSWRPLHKRS